jgi:hypothetical protein
VSEETNPEQDPQDLTPTELTELTDERRAVLSYFEAATLFEYQNHLRARDEKEQVTYREENKFEVLGSLYPNVVFTPVAEAKNKHYHEFIAEVRPEFEGTLLEAVGMTFLVDNTLETTIITDKHGLRFMYQTEDAKVIFCPNGTGYINDEGSLEFFEHDIDLEKLKEECKDSEDEIEVRLRDYFNDNVNDSLEDPYYDPSGGDQALYFEEGSEEELERLMQLFILTEPNIEKEVGQEVRIYAATDEGDTVYLDADDCYSSKRLDSLANLALETNQPVGWEMQYNDGAYDKRSGYSMTPECISYNIEEILELPARIRMSARRELKKWLETQGRTLEEFDALIEAVQVEDIPEDAGEAVTATSAEEEAGSETTAPEDEAPLFPTPTFSFTPQPSVTAAALAE